MAIKRSSLGTNIGQCTHDHACHAVAFPAMSIPVMNGAPQQKSYHEQMTVMLVSLAVSAVLLGLKVWAAEITGSSALYSDAAESIVHLIAVAIAVRALQLAHKPADQEHQFGHDKAAFLSAGFEGAMISTAALLIYYETGRSLLTGPHMEKIGIGLMLAGVATTINLVLGLILLRVGRKRQSPVLRANGQHVLSDVYTSVAVLFALVLVHFTGWPWWDPIMAVLAATNILFTGIKLIKESLGGLMDAADPVIHRHIEELVVAETRKHGITHHNLRHRNIGDAHHVELHLDFPADVLLRDAHRVATEIEDSLESKIHPAARVITHLECEGDHP
jgi:cation diffusion facilitator family transporter